MSARRAHSAKLAKAGRAGLRATGGPRGPGLRNEEPGLGVGSGLGVEGRGIAAGKRHARPHPASVLSPQARPAPPHSAPPPPARTCALHPAMWQPTGGGERAGGGRRRSSAPLGPRRERRPGPSLRAPRRGVSAPGAPARPGPMAGGAGARGRGAGSPGPLTHLRHGRVCAGGGGRAGIPGCGAACSLAAAPGKAGAPGGAGAGRGRGAGGRIVGARSWRCGVRGAGARTRMRGAAAGLWRGPRLGGGLRWRETGPGEPHLRREPCPISAFRSHGRALSVPRLRDEETGRRCASVAARMEGWAAWFWNFLHFWPGDDPPSVPRSRLGLRKRSRRRALKRRLPVLGASPGGVGKRGGPERGAVWLRSRSCGV